MSSTPEARHLTCSTCSQLRDREDALEHVQGDEDDTHLPEVANRLEVVREIRPGHPGLRLMSCPECGTYYLFRSVYEFLIGFGRDAPMAGHEHRPAFRLLTSNHQPEKLVQPIEHAIDVATALGVDHGIADGRIQIASGNDVRSTKEHERVAVGMW